MLLPSVSRSVTPVTGRGAHWAKNGGGEQFKLKNAFSCGDIFIAAQRTAQIARKHRIKV